MNLLAGLRGFWSSTDIRIDPGTLEMLEMLEQLSACDKHRALVEDAAIEVLQARIVERGGTVRKESLG